MGAAGCSALPCRALLGIAAQRGHSRGQCGIPPLPSREFLSASCCSTGLTGLLFWGYHVVQIHTQVGFFFCFAFKFVFTDRIGHMPYIWTLISLCKQTNCISSWLHRTYDASLVVTPTGHAPSCLVQSTITTHRLNFCVSAHAIVPDLSMTYA